MFDFHRQQKKFSKPPEICPIVDIKTLDLVEVHVNLFWQLIVKKGKKKKKTRIDQWKNPHSALHPTNSPKLILDEFLILAILKSPPWGMGYF